MVRSALSMDRQTIWWDEHRLSSYISNDGRGVALAWIIRPVLRCLMIESVQWGGHCTYSFYGCFLTLRSAVCSLLSIRVLWTDSLGIDLNGYDTCSVGSIGVMAVRNYDIDRDRQNDR